MWLSPVGSATTMMGSLHTISTGGGLLGRSSRLFFLALAPVLVLAIVSLVSHRVVELVVDAT
jgi:hypothetical protein